MNFTLLPRFYCILFGCIQSSIWSVSNLIELLNQHPSQDICDALCPGRVFHSCWLDFELLPALCKPQDYIACLTPLAFSLFFGIFLPYTYRLECSKRFKITSLQLFGPLLGTHSSPPYFAHPPNPRPAKV